MAHDLALPPRLEAFVYYQRQAAETPLYRLLESLYERRKGCWEERFSVRAEGTDRRAGGLIKMSTRRDRFRHPQLFNAPSIPSPGLAPEIEVPAPTRRVVASSSRSPS